MKSGLTLVLLLISAIVFCQDKNYYKNTTLHFDFDRIETQHYNAPALNPTRNTYGLRIGALTDVTSTPNFHLDFRLGYRFVNDYAHPKGITHFGADPLADSISFNYYGAYTGIGFNIGRRHLWENVLIIGGGVIRKPKFSISSGEMEMGVQSGYKYISPQGITFRAGISANFARNGFFSSMYSGYLGLGYTFQKTQGIVEKGNNTLEKGYFNINVSSYIGSITLDLVGFNFRFDHLIYNSSHVDLGYGISARTGLEYDEGATYSASFSFIGLFGQKPGKFEFTIGPNFPYEEITSGYLSWYEAIHVGIGLRYVSKNSPITLRLGSSTTSILHAGLGIKFPNR